MTSATTIARAASAAAHARRKASIALEKNIHELGKDMKVTVSIDVPSIEEGLKFFGEVFGFTETARPHPGYAILGCGESTIGLLAKPAGTSPAKGSTDVRRYERHWTPVHIDFRVEDFEATLKKALDAGAKSEQIHRVPGYPPVAFCSDPFGHGFCIVGLRHLDQKDPA